MLKPLVGDLKERNHSRKWKGLDWIHLAKDRKDWRSFAKAELIFGLCKMWGVS
jgi:hypothetical protein